MRRIILFAVILLIGLTSSLSYADAPKTLKRFMKGVSLKGTIPNIGMLHELGVTHARPELPWRLVEPELEPFNNSVEELRQNTDWLEGYVNSRDWKSFDDLINPLREQGIEPIAVVALGYSGNLARVNGTPADPNVIGEDEYLAHMYRYVRSTVHVFKDRVSIWQIENEVNEAILTSLFGWRHNEFGGSWWSWSFITRLMETLHAAVKDEDPNALTTLNFHSDIHPNFHYTPGTTKCKASLCVSSPNFVQAAVEWAHLLDIIAIDAYPNYYRASPVYGTDVGDRIRKLKAALPNKPVIVMETGYPVAAQIGDQASMFRFTEQRQATYFRDALRSTIEAGGEGFFVFGAWQSSGATLTQTASATELFRIGLLGQAFRNGDGDPVLSMLTDRNFLYERLPELLQKVESGWGIIGPNGQKREAFYVLQEEFSYIQPTTIHLERGINFIGFAKRPIGFSSDAFMSSDFLGALGSSTMIYHEQQEDRFLVTTKFDQGIGLNGHDSYIVISSREQELVYDGIPWTSTAVSIGQSTQYRLIHLPQKPSPSYSIQDLVRDSGSSFALIREGNIWKSYFPNSGGNYLLSNHPNLGILLISPRVDEMTFSKNPW